MIYIFSAFKEDRTGEKMVVAFNNFPAWQDIQTAAEADAANLNFFPMQDDLNVVKRGMDLGVNRVYSWKFQGFVCQIFLMELVQNGK